MNLIVKVSCEFLSPTEGGRQNGPPALGPQYRPHFRGAELLGIKFCESLPAPLPGKTVVTSVECVYPEVNYSELKPGRSFDIVEGNRKVGIATVIEQG